MKTSPKDQPTWGALPRSRPPGEPGPGINCSPIAPVCRSSESRPSVLIQRQHGFCARTKPRRVVGWTLVLAFLPSPILLLHRSSQSDGAARMGNGPPTPSQALRWHVRPPLGGRTTVERPRGGVSPRVRTDEVVSTRLLRVLIPSTLLQAVAGRDPFLSAHW
jgi:hypothetical protein